MQPEALRDLLSDTLSEAVSVLTADGASPPPERQYVAHGSVTADCELLAVNLVRVVPKLLDSRVERCAVLHQANIAVVLYRCYPVVSDSGTPPSAADLSTAGRNLALDGQALWKGLTRSWAEGSWPPGIACGAVTWGGLEPIAPLGGFAGWRLTVTVQL